MRLLFAVVLIGIALAGCGSKTPTTPAEKLGFVITTGNSSTLGYFYSSSSKNSIDIQVAADRIPSTIPEVYVAGQSPDESFDSPANWMFRAIKADTVVPYQIIADNDTLEGMIPIPATIDSIWCNDTLLDTTEYEQIIAVDSLYRFRWHSHADTNGYYLSYSYDANGNSSSSSLFTRDTEFTTAIPKDFSTNTTVALYVQKMGTPRLKNGSVPNNENATKRVYYSIGGPGLQKIFYIGRTGFMKVSSESASNANGGAVNNE